MILLLHAWIDLFAVLQILKSAECNPIEINRSKVMLPAQLLYLFDSSSSLRYLTVNCHILCAKLLWFQGGHAVHELLAIPRDASRSCSLRKLRHLSSETVHRVQVHDVLIYGNSPEEGIQKLPPLFLILKENEREMQMVSHLELSWWQLDLFPRWTRSFSLCATQAFQKIAVAMIQSKGLAVDMTCCTFSIFVFKNPWCNRMWKLIWLSIPSIRLAVVPSPHELSGKKKSHYIRWHDYVFVAPGAL